MHARSRSVHSGAALALAMALVACKSGSSTAGSSSAAPSASGPPPPFPLGVPVPAASVAAAINPKNEAPYSGPSGTLRGTIRITGDPPPETGLSFPPQCAEAAATYGKRFRVGQDGTVADVLVAVNYPGFIPAREEAKKLTIRGCALSKRTLSVTFGQRIEVSNLDKLESYMPYIDGARSPAVLVAVPGGDPVKLYPLSEGRYLIRDLLPKPFMHTEVFVLKYATHDVTGLDGRYEIKDVPATQVRISALLPAIGKTIAQMVDIAPGDNTLDLTFEYTDPAKAPPATSASAAPAKPEGSAGAPKPGTTKAEPTKPETTKPDTTGPSPRPKGPITSPGPMAPKDK
jgi:hypothetical protein